MKPVHRQILKLFWQKTAKHPWLILGIFLGLAGGIAADFVIPYVYKLIIDLVSNQSQDYAKIFQLLGIGFLASIILEQFWRLAGICNIKVQTIVTADLINETFDKIQNHSYAFFTNSFTGGLVKKVNRFVASYDRILTNSIWTFSTLLIRITASISIFILTDYRIALIFLGWLAIFLISLKYFLNFHVKYETSASKAETKVSSRLADTITNFENIKLFSGLRFERQKFNNVVTEATDKQAKSWYIFEGFFGFKGILMVIGEFGIMYVALKLWQQGEITIGTVILIQSYLAFIMFRIWDLTHVLKDIYSDLANAEEMMEIINTKIGIKDLKNAKDLKVEKGQIQFKNVTYLYNNKRPLFEKLNLKIKAKEKIALVGESGAGKSTFVKLLLRLYDLKTGEILIDGQSINQVTQDSLRANIAFVPQDPVMFHRTIMENIRYGKLDASDEEVIQAAKLARCHEFITKSKEGYHTMVGERGIKLSGGERQRIAIARAILKNAPVLVLDEATSSLDSKSEKAIQTALHNLMQNKTVIAIAHRLSTVREMDRIIVLENGKVLEEGKHDELIAKDAHYAELWHLQTSDINNSVDNSSEDTDI